MSFDANEPAECKQCSTNHIAEVCPADCAHEYDDGECLACGSECPHESVQSGICDDCCSHVDWVSRVFQEVD